MKTILSNILTIAILLSFQSCGDDDDPVFENEEELITDVILTLTPVGGGTSINMTFNDPDGEAGAADPTISVSGPLLANTTYEGEVSLLNSSVTPTENVTDEIKEEGDEHLFCYSPSDLDLEISITDNDENQIKLGILSSWVVGPDKGVGEVRLTLKHQPGVKDGTCAPGDTDIEIDFTVIIE